MDYALEYALMSDIYDEMTEANEGFFGNIGSALKRFWRWFTGKIGELIDNVKRFFANLKKKPTKPVTNASANSPQKAASSKPEPAKIESALEKECKELAKYIDLHGAIGQRISDELYGVTSQFERFMKSVKSGNSTSITSESAELRDRISYRGDEFIEGGRKVIEEIKGRVNGFDKESHAIYMHHIRNVAASRIAATTKYLEDTKRSCDRVKPYIDNIDSYDKVISGRPEVYGMKSDRDIQVNVRDDINDTMKYCNNLVIILTDYLNIVSSLA